MNEKIKAIAEDNVCIQRIKEKCVECGNCKNVCNRLVNISDECVFCGQCVLNCPVGALTPVYAYKSVLNYVKDTNYVLAISIAPAVRVSLGDYYNMPYGSVITSKLITALKNIGFKYVFDVSYGADITTIEESKELIERIENNGVLPMFSSCCPAWVRYLSIKHPNLLDNLSTTKSPIRIQGIAVKDYFSNIMNIPKENIIHVVVAPCTAKKYEVKKDPNIDFLITTTELNLMLKECNIDLLSLKESEFDKLFSESSGTGEMFGCTNGVTNSIVNYLTNKNNILNSNDNVINVNNHNIRCLSICGLTNFKNINLQDYDFIEVMSCENGCVGGGGEPLNPIGELSTARNARMEALKNINLNKNKLISDNTEIDYFYKIIDQNKLHNKKEEL